MPIFHLLVGAMNGAGEGSTTTTKITKKATFLDLEMLGEGKENGTSCWVRRMRVEMRTKMSNPAEHLWTKQREMSKIANRNVCKLFC